MSTKKSSKAKKAKKGAKPQEQVGDEQAQVTPPAEESDAGPDRDGIHCASDPRRCRVERSPRLNRRPLRRRPRR